MIPLSVLRQVREVGSILLPVLRRLHPSQSSKRTHQHGDAKQRALHGVFDELCVAGHAPRPLDHVEFAEPGHRGYVAPAPDHAGVVRGVERPFADRRQRGVQTGEDFGESLQILGIGVWHDIEIGGTANIPVGSDRHPADHNEANLSSAQCLEQGAKVEFLQFAFAAPLMALICLLRAWTCASRSLIGAARSAAIRKARARLNSVVSPLRAFAATGHQCSFAVSGIAVTISSAAILLTAAPAAQASFGFLPGTEGFTAQALAEGGFSAKQAGSHPTALRLAVNLQPEGGGPFTEGDLRDLSFELPPGLIEDPAAVNTCAPVAFLTPRNSPFEKSLSGESCPDRSQVGIVTVRSSYAGGQERTFGLFNLAPPPGAPAEIGANPYGAPLVFVPRVRQAEGEYGVTLEAHGAPQLVDVSGLELTLWGVPWSILHNAQRGNCLNEAEPSFGWSKCSIGRPSKNPATAYLTMPTFCDAPLTYTARATSWQGDGPATASSESLPLEGCDTLAFEPGAIAQLSDPRASSPSGYEFDIEADAAGFTNPNRRAPSPLRKAVVSLPEGVTINPSVGAGLGVCTPSQYAAESATSSPGVGCPNESKIGDFTVRTPFFPTIDGSIFLAAPFDNQFGSLIALYLVAKDSQRGILVKVAGELQADPRDGSLTATFDKLPQLPYSELRIHFREGQRSPLATPPACGQFFTHADFTAWRDPSLVRHASLPLQITSGIGGGPCPSGLAPFAPQAKGGTLNSQAGAYSPFYLHLTRNDTEQEIVSYSATFPPGLLGNVSGVPFCSEADLARAAHRSGFDERENPSCPAASLIGHTLSGYGLGPVLSYAPGNLYLAGPYNGSNFSVVAIDAALVGPFDLGTVIVRSAIRVDRSTGQVSIDATGTDPIPHIIDGIPVHLRDVRAYIDRPRTTINPTSCEPFTLASTLNGAGVRLGDRSDDTLATATAPFQAFNCGSLGFRPKLALRLRGGTKRGSHPSLRAVVQPRPGDANIGKAAVTLPASLFLDQDNIDTICTRAQFAAGRCPPGSVYGRARAFTPLLDEPFEGPVYLRSSDNQLPDVVFALSARGFEIDLVGRIDSNQGGIRGRFDVIPDAPVTKFVLRIRGGKRGILVSSAKDVCTEPQAATSRLLGHNNRGWVTHPVVQAKCGKKKHGHGGKATKGGAKR
jgi:hypothetical protein